MSAITAPASAIAERTVSVTWTTKNQGAYDAVGGWFDSVYLSSNATLTKDTLGSATLLSTTYQAGPLQAGQTYTGSASVRIPPCQSGPYYIYVFTDSRNNVYEYDPRPGADAENNNINQKAIALTSAQSDLTASSPVIPATVNAGQTAPVSWTVSNIGLGDTQQTTWTDTVYLSTKPNLSGASVIGSFTHSGALPKGQDYTQAQNVTIPVTVPEGDYYVIVYTDSGNVVPECDGDANNLGISTATTHVVNNPMVTHLPDLQIASISETGVFISTNTIAVNWTVINKGAGDAVGSWLDSVYINSAPSLSGATLLKSILHNGPLAVGASYDASANVTLPNLAPGTYYLLVYTDSTNAINEGILENNNIGVLGGGQGGQGGSGGGDPGSGGNPGSGTGVTPPNVDLQITTVDQPDTAFAGQDIPVSWTGKNFGTQTTLTPVWTDYILLSRDQILDPTDIIVGYQVHNGTLASGASYNATQTVTLPPGLTGPYYVFVYTDWNNNIAETNEFNNNTYDSKVLFINLPPPTDLTVTAVTPPAKAAPGETATFQWTVQNIGSNPAIGRWTDAVYLSKDQTWDIGDTLIGRVDHYGPLMSGASYSGSLITEVPAIAPGNYYLIVRTDVKNRVPESDETNNIGASVSPFPVDITELTLGVALASTLPQDKQRYYKANAPANETLLWTLDSQAPDSANELYVRYGDVASRGAYDFLFSNPYAPSQKITVPNTQAGFYYALARGNYVPTPPGPFTIKAEIIPFSITDVTPSTGGNAGSVTVTVRGAKFAPDASIVLTDASGKVITSTYAIFSNSSAVRAKLDLTSVPAGKYKIALVNADKTQAVWSQTFVVVNGGKPQIQMFISGARTVRVGRTSTWVVSYQNTGLIDLDDATMVAVSSSDLRIDANGPNVWPDLKEDHTIPNAYELVRLRDIAPGQKGEIPLLMTPLTINSKLNFKIGLGTPTLAKPRFLLPQYPASVYGGGPSGITTKNGPPPPPNSLVFEDNVNASGGHTGHVGWLFQGTDGKLYVWEDLPDGRGSVGYTQQGTRITPYEDFEKGPFPDGKPQGWQGWYQPPLTPAQTSALNDWMANHTGNSALPYTPIEKCTDSVNQAFSEALGQPLTGDFSPLMSPAELFERLAHREMAPDDNRFPNPQTWKWPKDVIDCRFYFNCAGLAKDIAHLFGRDDLDAWIDAWFNLGDFINSVRASDPNDKIGPSGFGPQAFVPVNKPLPYTIDFENMATAGAAAQQIVITDQLDPAVDPRTFRLKEIGFGSYKVTVPDNRSYYQTRLQLGPDLGNILADISAGVDVRTGLVTWTLSAVDPKTGEAPNSASLGLLPPNDATHRGEGYVTYTVQAKDGTATGTALTNAATIVFDTEQPIPTNAVTNTIDGLAPTSTVAALPATSQATFTVSWSGTDDTGGSGLASYDIYVADNDGPFQPWQTTVTTTSASYPGVPGHTYQFYSVARDNAGNVESKTAADTATGIQGITGTVTLEGIPNIGAVVVPVGPITFEFRPLDGSAAITQQVVLGANGGFTLSGIPAKKYNVWIKGAKWLAKVITVDASTGGASGINVSLDGGDANNDNAVDIGDFGLLVNSYLGDISRPGSGYLSAADFNCDGVIDIADFSDIVNHYNTGGAP